jgi:hypothetical protein
MTSDADWLREYVAARLVEINERLADLDARPDAVGCHEVRRRLVAEGVELLAALATFGREEPSLT